MLACGVNMKVVQERLGHSSMVMTADIYSHVQASLQREAVEKLDDLATTWTLTGGDEAPAEGCMAEPVANR
jgi:hypothetical protein